jgi:hypothetical protein
MKIKTDLHAGNLLDDAKGYASEALASVSQFVNAADEEATSLYQQGVNSSQALWEELKTIF